MQTNGPPPVSRHATTALPATKEAATATATAPCVNPWCSAPPPPPKTRRRNSRRPTQGRSWVCQRSSVVVAHLAPVHSCARVAVHDLPTHNVCIGDPVVWRLHAAHHTAGQPSTHRGTAPAAAHHRKGKRRQQHTRAGVIKSAKLRAHATDPHSRRRHAPLCDSV
jgi:hypothetical protein